MKKKLTVAAATIILALIAIVMGGKVADTVTVKDVVTFVLETDAGPVTIKPWDSGEGMNYVFLPSFAKFTDLKARAKASASLNGTPIKDFNFASLKTNTPYTLTFRVFGKKTTRKLTFLKSANVATMFVDTQSGTMDAVEQKKGIKENISLTVLTKDGKTNYLKKDTGDISGRGNATWALGGKRPYAVNLKKPASILNMNESVDWTLLANSNDFSNLRNKIVYDFSAKVMPCWTPKCEYVDLYLNGVYKGLYLLTEKKGVAENKINLPDDGKSFLFESDLLFRLEPGVQSVQTSRGKLFKIVFPKHCSTEQTEYLESKLRTVENGITENKSWNIPLDLDSAARRFMIDEIFMNADADSASSFYYIIDEKIYAGPVWDYDSSICDNTILSWCKSAIYPDQIFALNPDKHIKDELPRGRLWYCYMYNNPIFRAKVKELYKTEYRPLLVELSKNLKTKAETLKTAAEMNLIRQKEVALIVDCEVIPYGEQVVRIDNFLSARIRFLDKVWINNEEYINIFICESDEEKAPVPKYYTVKPGVVPADVIEGEKELYVKGTAEKANLSEPITESVIYSRLPHRELSEKEELIEEVKKDEGIVVMPAFIVAAAALLLWEILRNRRGKK
ncbi:MAG: CotH kinase family protein [Abditibacteriota bacterium]|nr:CotH kinase family protein [Abditibacteriota bacterium]